MLTKRTVEALDATRLWLAEAPEFPTRQRVALRVALMLITVTYEVMGPAASHAMAIQFGGVLAPDTAEHRRAIRAAAEFVAELVASADVAALGELGRAYQSLFARAVGPAPAPLGQLPDRLSAAIRPAMSIVRSAVLGSWERLPAMARLRIAEVDTSRRIAGRAAADPEVDRLSALLGIRRAGRRPMREREALLVRAGQLGRELGPEGSLDLLAEALGHAQTRFLIPGARNLLRGAGETASRDAVAAGVQRMRAEPLLRPYLAGLLEGAMRGPRLPGKTLREFAADPETAIQTVDVLDHVTPTEERRLTRLLLEQPVAHIALAHHLRSCRQPEAERAQALIELAEQADTDVLAHVLEQFGRGGFWVDVPAPLRERFTAQMERLAREAALDRRDAGDVTGAFTLLVRWGDASWLRILDARRQAMLKDAGAGGFRLWDLLPDYLAPALAELSDLQRDKALPHLAAWHEATGNEAVAWRIEHGLTELLPRVGTGRPVLTEILGQWYVLGGQARARTLRLLRPLLDQGAADAVLDVILEKTATPEDESELIGALSIPPISWVGDLEVEYSKRADEFAKRSRHGRRHARAFARIAEAHLRRLAEAEARETQRRSEGYAN